MEMVVRFRQTAGARHWVEYCKEWSSWPHAHPVTPKEQLQIAGKCHLIPIKRIGSRVEQSITEVEKLG